MRLAPRRTAKISPLPCVLLPDARQRVSHAVSSQCHQLLFFAVRHEKTHGKDYLPFVVRRGARQKGFTVQNATVCPLPCARRKTHGKEFAVRFKAFAVQLFPLCIYIS
jgi:predicted secreted Zn-dependent protease